MLRVEGSVSRYPWDLESCWISGAIDEKGGGSLEKPVRRLFGSWCSRNSTGGDLHLGEV